MSFAKPAVAFAVRNVCRQLLYRSAEPWTPTRYQSDKAGQAIWESLCLMKVCRSLRNGDEHLDGWLKKKSDLVVEIVEAGMKLSSNTKQKYRLNMIERKLSLSDA